MKQYQIIIISIAISFVVFGLLSACKKENLQNISTHQACKSNIKQGIVGQVIWKEGNLRPQKNKPMKEGLPIERKILIYKLTHIKQITQIGRFYENPTSVFVGATQSNEKGCFEMDLEVGQYSIFVEEVNEKGIKKLYANSLDTENNIFKIEITRNKQSYTTIIVDYKARY
ncbi:MAG: hypothetical protein EAZ85_01345 [Bacteroidetes bacterium]|nr:MAG: hypothetical protein EAZ85_01345 [Bacteroidota bacterium]TAG92568.1 MAG: hypothetical protein EAZ20_02405 [Bacteroidota bacterium]